MRIAVTLVLPILLILSLLGFDFLYARHVQPDTPAGLRPEARHAGATCGSACGGVAVPSTGRARRWTRLRAAPATVAGCGD
ncbi:hypothetical protein [Pseudomonas paraeruginosa]|uniref:hypothetical protein n=1 Tax=Pseudomonas paraeruginosa TaxID=2994495 RepID=UPI0039FC6F09|nr:hypothetical protein [Pseudomonas aeruginosa]HCF2414845.1 hypothetical protein [Pseudomonas aeruginosa]